MNVNLKYTSVTLTQHVSTRKVPMHVGAKRDMLETVKSVQVRNKIYHFYLKNSPFKAWDKQSILRKVQTYDYFDTGTGSSLPVEPGDSSHNGLSCVHNWHVVFPLFKSFIRNLNIYFIYSL